MLSPSVTAIPTRYHNRHFRSRLEARWARFFDEMCFCWEYEPQGFELANGDRYLPDFYFPEYEWFAEVKPTIAILQKERKALTFARESHLGVLILDGEPDFRSYAGYQSFDEEDRVRFDKEQYSLDVHFFGTARSRLWSQPDYDINRTAQGDIDPEGLFSPQYIRAVAAALSERFEAA